MDKIKLYPLHLGNTKVPYGQFYGGDAWSGLRGIWRFVTAKDRYIIAPIYAFSDRTSESRGPNNGEIEWTGSIVNILPSG